MTISSVHNSNNSLAVFSILIILFRIVNSAYGYYPNKPTGHITMEHNTFKGNMDPYCPYPECGF